MARIIICPRWMPEVSGYWTLGDFLAESKVRELEQLECDLGNDLRIQPHEIPKSASFSGWMVTDREESDMRLKGNGY